MKKTITALLFISLSSFASAQGVQIGTNVSIGGIPNLSVDVTSDSIQPGNLVAAKNEYTTVANGSTVTLIDYSSGLASARPAFGTAGRFYYATDTSNGTLYKDSGSAWVVQCDLDPSDVSHYSPNCGGGPGYLEQLWDTGNALTDTIKVYYDGNVSPDINLTFQQMWGVYGAVSGTVETSKYTSFVQNSSAVSFWDWSIRMPFVSAIKITATNNSGSSETMFSKVRLQTGVSDAWANNTSHLYIAQFSQVSCPLNSTATLMNVSGSGKLFGVQMQLWGTETNATEGNIDIFVDGRPDPADPGSGFEDFYRAANNWKGFPAPYNALGGIAGVYLGSIGSGSSPNPIGAYRFFTDGDTVIFKNGITMTFGCGESGHGSTGNPNVDFTGWYYK